MGEIIRGSRNVYKDLDFADAEEMQAKAKLASRIISIIQKKKWSQEEAAVFIGLTQPKISLLSRGQFSGFSIGKLIRILNKLNQDIEITIISKPILKKTQTGKISVVEGVIYRDNPSSTKSTRIHVAEKSDVYTAYPLKKQKKKVRE